MRHMGWPSTSLAGQQQGRSANPACQGRQMGDNLVPAKTTSYDFFRSIYKQTFFAMKQRVPVIPRRLNPFMNDRFTWVTVADLLSLLAEFLAQTRLPQQMRQGLPRAMAHMRPAFTDMNVCGDRRQTPQRGSAVPLEPKARLGVSC